MIYFLFKCFHEKILNMHFTMLRNIYFLNPSSVPGFQFFLDSWPNFLLIFKYLFEYQANKEQQKQTFQSKRNRLREQK